MNRVFWGMAVVLLDMNLPFGAGRIGLLPDCLGWWLLLKGCTELQWAGPRRKGILLAMAVGTLVLYGMRFQDLTVRQQFVLYILDFLAAAAGVAAAGLLIRGIRQLEQRHGKKLHSDKLKNMWGYLAVICVVKGLLGWMPVVGPVCAVAAFAMGLCWLAVLWKTAGLYALRER